MEISSELGLQQGERFRTSGLVLAAGAVCLFVGSMFYSRLPQPLGLPSPPSQYAEALEGALRVGGGAMARAGGFAFAGDVLLLAGAMVLVRRRGASGSDLEPVGWALMGISALGAMTFDSLMAVGLYPLAKLNAGAFTGMKTWFDFLFAAGNLPFGLGAALIFWADSRSRSRALPQWVDAGGIALSAIAIGGSLAYVLGVAALPLAIGPPILGGCVLFTALGIQIARRG